MFKEEQLWIFFIWTYYLQFLGFFQLIIILGVFCIKWSPYLFSLTCFFAFFITSVRCLIYPAHSVYMVGWKSWKKILRNSNTNGCFVLKSMFKVLKINRNILISSFLFIIRNPKQDYLICISSEFRDRTNIDLIPF